VITHHRFVIECVVSLDLLDKRLCLKSTGVVLGKSARGRQYRRVERKGGGSLDYVHVAYGRFNAWGYRTKVPRCLDQFPYEPV